MYSKMILVLESKGVTHHARRQIATVRCTARSVAWRQPKHDMDLAQQRPDSPARQDRRHDALAARGSRTMDRSRLSSACPLANRVSWL